MSSLFTPKSFFDNMQHSSPNSTRKSMPEQAAKTKEPYAFAYNPEKQMETARFNPPDAHYYRYGDRLTGSTDKKPSETERYSLQYNYYTNSGLKTNPYLQQIQVPPTNPDPLSRYNPYSSSYHKLRPVSNIQYDHVQKSHRPTMSALQAISPPKNTENSQSCLYNIPPLPLQQKNPTQEGKKSNPHHLNAPSNKPVISLGKSGSTAKNLALAKPIAIVPTHFQQKSQPKPVTSEMRMNEASTQRKFNFLHNMDMQKLKQQNRQLSSQLFALRMKSPEIEQLKLKISSLENQMKSKDATHNDSMQNLQSKTRQVSDQLESYRRLSENTIKALRQEVQQKALENNKLKDLVERQLSSNKQLADQRLKDVEHHAQEQKQLLQSQLNIAQQKYENAMIELNYEMEQHARAKQQIQSYKTKLREHDRFKEWEDQAQEARLVLQDKIAQLASHLQKQKTEHQQVIIRNHEYEKQVKALKGQIDKLNKEIKELQQQNNEFKSQITDIKAETKNLLSLSRRSSASLEDSRSFQEKHSLVQQLGSKIEEIGQLKKKIGHMAGELSRIHETGEHAQLRDRVVKLEQENQRLRKRANSNAQFDDILKVQLTETQKYKETLNSKTEIILQLREQLKVASMEIDQLRREIEVDRLRKTIEKKNLEAQQNIEREAKQADIEKLKSSVRALEDKVKYWSGECRKKDEFMQTHLLGKISRDAQRAIIIEFFKQFQRQFKTN